MDAPSMDTSTGRTGITIGTGAPVSGSWANPGSFAAFAQLAESLGYQSLWTFQRLLVPTGSQLGPVYHSVLDPMVSLGFAAALTSRIRLGVAVVNHPFISPLLLAKQAATVDVLSGGRLDLGLGSGWMPEEFTGSGAEMSRRGPRMTEYVAALRALWAPDGISEFKGEYYTVPAGRQDPPPVQRPGPPVILGGVTRAALERAGRVADGWVTASATDLAVIGASVQVVQEAAAAAGRGPARSSAGNRAPRRAADLRGHWQAGSAFRQLRADPRRRGLAGVSGRHRGLLRPELGSGHRGPRRGPGRGRRPRRPATGIPRARGDTIASELDDSPGRCEVGHGCPAET